MNLLKGIADRLGIDKAVLYSACARGWSVLSGVATIFILTHFLTAELQGYYYMFSSLIAVQVLAELGLTVAIVQFAAHEMAELHWETGGILTGDGRAKRRLRTLMVFAFSWFGVAAVLMTCILIPLGIRLMSEASDSSLEKMNVAVPWTLLVLAAAIGFFATGVVAFLEGCGKVVEVAGVRFLQAVVAACTIWIVLASGGGLYALPVSLLFSVAVAVIWVLSKHTSVLVDLYRTPESKGDLKWREEIWPFQWRVAVSWIGGYLGFQLLTPLLFRTWGAVTAGKLGMSMQVFLALNSVAMVWITTKVPTYGRLVAQGKRRELDALFTRGLIQSFLVLFVCVAIVGGGLEVMVRMGLEVPNRLLPLPLLGLLAIACLGNHIVFAQASYLRSHKIEPFMWLSVIGGMACAGLAVILIPAYGALGAVCAYVAATLVVGVAGGTSVFLRVRFVLSRT